MTDARGRPPLRKTAPEAVKLAKRLNGRGLSLRRIAGKLAEAGQLNERGSPTMRRACGRCCGGRRNGSGPGESQALS